MFIARLLVLLFALQGLPSQVFAQVDFERSIHIPVSLGLDAYGSTKNFKSERVEDSSDPFISDYVDFDARPAKITIVSSTTVRLTFENALHWDIHSASSKDFLHHQVLKTVLIQMSPEVIESILPLRPGLLVPPDYVDGEWLSKFNSLQRPTDYDEYVKEARFYSNYPWVKIRALSFTLNYNDLGRTAGATIENEIYAEGEGLDMSLQRIPHNTSVSIPLADKPMLIDADSETVKSYKQSIQRLLARENEIKRRGWALGLHEERSSDGEMKQSDLDKTKIVSLSEFRSCRGVFKKED